MGQSDIDVRNEQVYQRRIIDLARQLAKRGATIVDLRPAACAWANCCCTLLSPAATLLELPAKSPLLMQIYSDVLYTRITLAESGQSVALGAAILGCMAAGESTSGYSGMTQIIRAMARQRTDIAYHPSAANAATYNRLYALYRRIANEPSGVLAHPS